MMPMSQIAIKVLEAISDALDSVKKAIDSVIWRLHRKYCLPCAVCGAECHGTLYRALDPRLCADCWNAGARM
jgi:hypothetical protein